MQDLEVRVDAAGLVALPAWAALKGAVEQFRDLQSQDGSIDAATQDTELAGKLLDVVAEQVGALAPHLPHDAAYHGALVADLRRWADEGFGVPDFLDSLLAFQPAAAPRRRPAAPGRLPDVHAERQPGPQPRGRAAARGLAGAGSAELERTRTTTRMFVPVTFEDFTAGYDTNSAVLFPETVAVREAPERSPGAASSATARPPASARSPRPPSTPSA